MLSLKDGVPLMQIYRSGVYVSVAGGSKLSDGQWHTVSSPSTPAAADRCGFSSELGFFSSCAPGSAQAGGEQPGPFCDPGDGRLRQTGGGDASRAAGGGPVRGAPTGPGRRPDQLGPYDGSGEFAFSTGSCS